MADSLDHQARRYLWGHFTRLAGVQRDGMPIIERGEGAYVYDTDGKKYLDGLSGLFTVNIGHGRRELADAAAAQTEKLSYFPLWSFGTPPAIELAARLADLAPGDLNRVFFTTGGGEAVESAWKLAMQYFAAIGQPQRRKVISRDYAYHGTSLGALSITGIPAIREPFEPLLPTAVKIRNTNRYRCVSCADAPACTLDCADDLERRILSEGPETVAMVIMEPVQNTGGTLVPPEGYWKKVRGICDKYGVLLVSDEVICAFGRLGHMFGCDRFGYQPDMITFAKGVTSGYSALGGVIVSDRIASPFVEDAGRTYLHGSTFGGHPVGCAVALANLDVLEREDLCGNVLRNEPLFDDVMAALAELPIVGDVRGCGYFRVAELVRDKETKETFSDEESEWLLRGVLSPILHDAGLICRADDRADPVVVLSPTLVCGEKELEFIRATLHHAFTAAWDEYRRR
ncbi:MAG: aspartate aminotransferase family protein [Actinobacteria bacterium]|nr:aspartate aminotransferase family protein [Actinomycetota bacterium]